MQDFLRSVGKRIGSIGGTAMLHPDTGKRGEAVGLGFIEFYALGRAGALGDAAAPAVISAFGFFSPSLAEGVWKGACEKISPSKAAEHYSIALADWGRDRFGDIEGLDAFCDLAQRVADAGEPAGLPLFAAWRAMPLVDDVPGRAMQLVQVLREFRGGANVIGVRAVGLSPLEAVMANSGDGMAKMYGWPEPFPDPVPLRDRAAEAEEITDRIVGPAYGVLAEAERGPFATAVEAMAKAAGL